MNTPALQCHHLSLKGILCSALFGSATAEELGNEEPDPWTAGLCPPAGPAPWAFLAPDRAGCFIWTITGTPCPSNSKQVVGNKDFVMFIMLFSEQQSSTALSPSSQRGFSSRSLKSNPTLGKSCPSCQPLGQQGGQAVSWGQQGGSQCWHCHPSGERK